MGLLQFNGVRQQCGLSRMEKENLKIENGVLKKKVLGPVGVGQGFQLN